MSFSTGLTWERKTAPFIRTDEEFDERNVERIRSWGFNAVRLDIIWEDIAPEAGTVNDTYVDRVAKLTWLLDQHGNHVFLDMHQDLYSREFNGDGVPEWAVHTDGIPYRRSDPWQLDYTDPTVARAFDNFWLDNYNLQSAFSAAFTAVAKRVRDIDGLIWYGLFNEPTPARILLSGLKSDTCHSSTSGSVRYYGRSMPARRCGTNLKASLTAASPRRLAKLDSMGSFTRFTTMPIYCSTLRIPMIWTRKTRLVIAIRSGSLRTADVKPRRSARSLFSPISRPVTIPKTCKTC